MTDVPNNANSIQLLPTKDLIEELFNRFDCCVFIGSQAHSESQGGLGWNCKGDYFTLVGLVDWVAHRIEEIEPTDPCQLDE